MKTILHLCADIGSDSRPYVDAGYDVILVGKSVGVENYHCDRPIHGVIANPACTDFSIAKNKNSYGKPGLEMVNECLRIISECDPKWWVIENPASGSLKRFLGSATYEYEPWWYGSPWTKKTALWGKFNVPPRKYASWDDVPKNPNLYVRPGRKTSLVWLHKRAVNDIPEFAPFAHLVRDDADLRSLCSQGFAKAFMEVNP